jgi:TolB protein
VNLILAGTMKSMRMLSSLLLGTVLCASTVAGSQSKPEKSEGLFTGSTDIGKTLKGSSVYDASTGTYRVTGGGDDMWGAADSFHMTWVKVSGDATITADVHFAEEDWFERAKAVLLFRQNLEPGSAYADIALHYNGLVARQSRATANENKTESINAPDHGSVRLRLVRKGNTFTTYEQASDGSMNESGSTTVVMQDPVYVGLGVCSHKADGLNTAIFSNVTIEQGAHP